MLYQGVDGTLCYQAWFKTHVDRGNLMIIVFSTTLGTSELQKKFLHVWFEGENTCSEYEEAESCVQEHKRRS